MTRRFVEMNGVQRQAEFGPEKGRAERFGSVWHAPFIDITTGQPPQAPVRVAVQPKGPLVSRSGSTGLAGVAGAVTSAYPDLPGAPVPLELRATADGYLPVDIVTTVTADPAHPDVFVPAGPPTPVAMEPGPIALTGRVQRRGPSGLEPVAGATVVLAGLWSTAAEPGTPLPPAQAAEVIALGAPLVTRVPAGTGLRRFNLNAPVATTSLAASVGSGTQVIRLADRSALAPGNLISLGADGSSRQELVRIDSLDPDPPQPFAGDVRLVHPLLFDHLQGTEVSRRTGSVAGPSRALSRDASSGALTLMVDQAQGLFASGFVRVGAGPAAQHRRVAAYRVTSDAEGFYRLPPLHGIARALIDVSDAISSLTNVVWQPRYGTDRDVLNLELPP